jgi:hypothetical protein
VANTTIDPGNNIAPNAAGTPPLEGQSLQCRSGGDLRCLAQQQAAQQIDPSKDWAELNAKLRHTPMDPVLKFLEKNREAIRCFNDMDTSGNPIVSDKDIARIKEEYIKALGLTGRIDPTTVALAHDPQGNDSFSFSLVAKDPNGKGGLVANPDKVIFNAVTVIPPEPGK